MHGAIDRGFDTLFKISCQVTDIAPKDFIATLPPQYDLAMPRSQLGNEKLRKRSRAGHRKIEMVDHSFNILDKVLRGNIYFMQLKSMIPSQFTSIFAFVIGVTEGKLSGKRAKLLAEMFDRQRGDDT